ncbi:hypothetical protein BDV06DRAFT_228059 [Aspergillus oleicola]
MGGMIRFDGADPSNLSWTNVTLGDGSLGVDVPNLHAGAMLYIPSGNQGMLISFGGRNLTESLSRGENPPIEADWLDVFIYDVESHTWWIQRASGNAPTNRISFCAAVTESPDGSAFHITTYGGWSRPDGRSYEDVHILSIPAFEWIDASDQTSPSNSEDDPDRDVGRDVLTGACQTYRGSQMIVLGGDVRAGRQSVTDGECSNLYYPICVLDLSTYEWRTNLDTEATYEVPPLIYREIGGDQTNGATNNSTQNTSQSSATGNSNHATTTSFAGNSFPSAVNDQGQPLSKEEADRLYEERMEEEYAKREGGA